MNCPKCNSELRPGAKFCTRCGEKIEVTELCPQCGSSLKVGAKFCTRCGCQLASSNNAATKVQSEEYKAPNTQMPSDMNTAKGRMYWNVQPGQVARVITEAEFESYNKIRGVIVPEGTTAYIRANGRTIASISGGSYEFVEAEHSSFISTISKGWKFVMGLFANRKKTEQQSEPTEQEIYMHQQKVIWENAKNGAVFSVIILLDKAFPLLIGSKQARTDEFISFAPMKIRTNYLDLNLGVNAYFKITDPERFIIHYLTDKQMLNSTLIVNEISDSIRMVLQDALYDVELTSTRIPKELHQMLKDRINAVAAEAFFGLSIVRIVEISADNEDLARFEKLSQELYLSDKELDYLRRTNDFKNRLSDVVHEQEIHQATSDLELKRKLNEINRNSHNEELLHADELRKFEHLLINERIVREARTEQERNNALMEIAKTGLIRKEELDVLHHQLKTNAYQRGTALAMMQLRDGIEFERVRIEGETANAELIVKKELELQGLKDSYEDNRFYNELAKQKAVEDTKLDLEQRKRDIEYYDKKRNNDIERENDNAQFQQFMDMVSKKYEHEEEMKRMNFREAQNLSEEKIWALQGGDAAVAFVQNKYNAERERETAERMEMQRKETEARLEMERKETAERMEMQRKETEARIDAHRKEQEARVDAERRSHDNEQRKNTERMFDMMEHMMAIMGGAQSRQKQEQERRYEEKMEEKNRQIRERDERILRQEGRMDTAYDRALDYSTREKVYYQTAPSHPYSSQPVEQQVAPQQYVHREARVSVCPFCNAPIDEGDLFCGHCSKRLK